MKRVPLTGKHGTGRFALVDDADFERVVAEGSWHASVRSGRVYVRNAGGYLHRFILDAPAGVDVDHIDGDGTRCTRDNLRLATRAENSRNNRGRTDHGNPYKGITRQGRRWRAQITIDRICRYIGTYATAEGAARAYDAAARKHFGPFACVNYPRPGERSALPPCAPSPLAAARAA